MRVDDRAGGRAATRHLVNLGHERIAFLGIDEVLGDAVEWDPAKVESFPERP